MGYKTGSSKKLRWKLFGKTASLNLHKGIQIRDHHSPVGIIWCGKEVSVRL